MANFIDETNVVKVKFSSPSGFSLSYADLMSHLFYTPDKDQYPIYRVLDEETESNKTDINVLYQHAINTAITERNSFNATIYTAVQRKDPITNVMREYKINNTNYSHIKLNNYHLERPLLSVEGSEDEIDMNIPSSRVISEMKSLYFNGAKTLSFEIDSMFTNEQETSESSTNENEPNTPSHRGIKDGESFFIYITFDTIDNRSIAASFRKNTPVVFPLFPPKTATIYYQFIYAESEPEEDEEQNEQPENPSGGNGGNEGGGEDYEYTPGEDIKIPDIDIYDLTTSNSLAEEYIFLNAVSAKQIRETSSFPLICNNGLLKIHVSPMCPFAFNYSITINRLGKATTYTYKYVPKNIDVTGVQLPRLTKMNNPDVSYALLHTNPKLTGNIKVVVDDKSNLYLDTFKVNDTLTNKKYRHIKVGGDSYYGSGIMKFFKDVPTTDLYMIEDKCCNIFTTTQTFDNQYYDTYRYGVKTNDDKLYSENFALLAPLCVKRVLPDFFLVFRIDKDPKDYSENFTDEQKLEYFLRYGKVIKSYDMRKDSILGKYIRNIYNNSKGYQGDIFVSYDTDNCNKFIGISLDRGVVAPMIESVFLEKEINNQVAMNDFYTSGFERNHIVSKDIINFEFLFNDLEKPQFSINTYFGLYVKVNEEDSTFSCLSSKINEETDVLENTFDYDDLHTYPLGTDLRYSPKGTLLYGLTTPDKFIRLDSGLYDSEEVSKYTLLPYKNILTSHIDIHNFDEVKSFITFELQDALEVGEHIRVIDLDNKSIYEIIASSIDSLDVAEGVYKDSHDLSDVVINYFNEYTANFTVYRQNIFIEYKNTYDDVCSAISKQTEQLYYAFKKFKKVKSGITGGTITSYAYDKDLHKLSITSSSSNVIFERICSAGGFVHTIEKYLLETNDEDNAIKFFGNTYPEKTILTVSNISSNSTSPVWKSSAYSYLYPFNFDITGNRMAYIIDFIKIENISDDNNFYSVEVPNPEIFDARTLIYYNNSEEGEITKKYDNIEIRSYKNYDGSSAFKGIDFKTFNVGIVESYKDFNKSIINVKSPVLQPGNTFLLYSAYPLNAGICSILNFKNFSSEVLDADTAILSVDPPQAVGEKGEYSKISFFNERPVKDYETQIGLSSEDEIVTQPDPSTEGVSMYCEGDSVLESSNDTFREKYVIKHMTLEEFKADIVKRIKETIIPTSKKVYVPSWCNAINSGYAIGSGAAGEVFTEESDGRYSYEIQDIITSVDKQHLERILGIDENYGEYAGYILRPYIPGTNVYDKSYSLFNHLVKFKYNEYSGPTIDVDTIDGATEFIDIDNDGAPDTLILGVQGESQENNIESEFSSIGESGAYKIYALGDVEYVAESDKNTVFYYFPVSQILKTASDIDEWFVRPIYTTCTYYTTTLEEQTFRHALRLPPFTSTSVLSQGSSTSNANVVKITSHDLYNILLEAGNNATAEQLQSSGIRITTDFLNDWLNEEDNKTIIERHISVFSNNWESSAFVPKIISSNGEEENFENPIEISNNLDADRLEKISASETPILSLSEESIKDYIDNNRIFDSSLSSLSFAANNQSHIKNRSNYLEKLFNAHHITLDTPLVSPKSCKWKAIGTDARVEGMRIMNDFDKLQDSSSFYIPYDNEYDDYLGTMLFENKNNTTTGNDTPNSTFPKYIAKSLNDVCFLDSSVTGKIEKTGQTLKTCILYGNGNVDDILYDMMNSSSRFSVSYLSGSNTLEFISGGIKFKIHSTNDNIIDLSKYAGYSAVFVNLPIANTTSNKEIEIIIDEISCEIMFVWYSYTNTLRYGFKSDPNKKEDLVVTSLITNPHPYRIKYREELKDVICSQSMDENTSVIFNTLQFKDSSDIGKFGSSSEYIDENGNNTHTGKTLINTSGYIWLSNIDINDSKYSKHNNICITGNIFNSFPFNSSSANTYPYYTNKDYITIVEPYIWHNDPNRNSLYQFHDSLNNSLVDNLIFNTPSYKECILYSDASKLEISSKRTISDLKKSLPNYSIFIKSLNGTKDFTMLEDILEISIVDPIKYNRSYIFNKQSSDLNDKPEYFVHSTYASPVMEDIFGFNYNSKEIELNTHPANKTKEEKEDSSTGLNTGLIVIDPNEQESSNTSSSDDSLESIFGKSFDGANVSIKSVRKLPQVWINKYSENSSYCIQADLSISSNSKFYMSFDVVKNVSVFNDSWENTKYRKYDKVQSGNVETETYYTLPGYTAGNELKTFFNSRGIVLNSNVNKSITITNWKNTHISYASNSIKLDITDSLIYAILQEEPFIVSWNNLNLPTNNEKIKYIKNNILKHVIINNKTKFVLSKEKNNIKTLKFNGVFPTESNNLEEVKNFKNELVYENGKYFMNVYPEDKHMFYAKLIISF